MTDDHDKQVAAARAAGDQLERAMLDTVGPEAARVEKALLRSGCSPALAVQITMSLIGPALSEAAP